jgi:hypothetical protein
MAMAPYSSSASEDIRKIADPRLRRELAALVREAKVMEEQAVVHLEQARRALTR